MKYLSLFLLFATFCSCGKDDQLSDTIVGIWKLTSLGISDCPDASNNVANSTADVDGCLTIIADMICQEIVFNADGTAVLTSVTNGDSMSQALSYTINDETNEVTTCDASNNCNTVTVSNNRISLISPFGDCTIISQYQKS